MSLELPRSIIFRKPDLSGDWILPKFTYYTLYQTGAVQKSSAGLIYQFLIPSKQDWKVKIFLISDGKIKRTITNRKGFSQIANAFKSNIIKGKQTGNRMRKRLSFISFVVICKIGNLYSI